ncbi:MAG TPA: hypothetical protein VES02_02260, partial [Dermatophilaceae bacterium]|nr:hypothetical protein [Dermatophilaceae bacterium]
MQRNGSMTRLAWLGIGPTEASAAAVDAVLRTSVLYAGRHRDAPAPRSADHPPGVSRSGRD